MNKRCWRYGRNGCRQHATNNVRLGAHVVHYCDDPTHVPAIKENEMNDTTEMRQCPTCHVFTMNGTDHVCTRYDGPPCMICGAGTVAYTVGAPGFGSGVACENGHDVPTSPQGILTPEQTR